MTKIGKQREIFNLAFDKLGGLDRLIQWANEEDAKGNSNYSEFIKLYIKLVPAVKESKIEDDTQETFIKMIMSEEKKRIKENGTPVKLIEVDVIETQSQDDLGTD